MRVAVNLGIVYVLFSSFELLLECYSSLTECKRGSNANSRPRPFLPLSRRLACSHPQSKKFRTIEHGAWTNRILHVRYLSVSPHWAIFKASDEGAEEGEAPPGDAAESEDEGGAVVGAVRRVGAIGRNHIVTNPDLVKKRVVRALKAREQWFMPHGQMASSIVSSPPPSLSLPLPPSPKLSPFIQLAHFISFRPPFPPSFC